MSSADAAPEGDGLPRPLTRDGFLGGRLTVLQPEHGDRAGIDAVLLAAAVPARAGRCERVLEAGAGSGVVALALACRVGDVRVTGVEVQAELVALARENARLNRLSDRVAMVGGDVTAPLSRLPGLKRESFAHVVANPPFHVEGTVRAAQGTARRRARAAPGGAIGRWTRFLAAMAAPGATATLIHLPEALGSILEALAGRFGGTVVFPLFPRPGAPASRILVQAVKGSRAPLRLAPGLVLHEADGRFTDAAENVLRHAAPLPLA